MEKTMSSLQSYNYQSLVVKIGGSVLGSQDTSLQDIVELQQQGTIPVVIHGGGQVISQWMEKQGAQPSFVNGLRVTDDAGMEIVAATLGGLVNKNLVASIYKLGGKAIGMSGVDGEMLQAEILSPAMGYVGRILKVDCSPILQAIEGGYIPIIAPVALHVIDSSEHSGALLNINGDTAAGEIARALEANGIVFLTDVEGIIGSDSKLISKLTNSEAADLISAGTVAGGMVPKVEACLHALEKVGVAQILDGRKSRALLDFVEGRPLGTRIG